MEMKRVLTVLLLSCLASAFANAQAVVVEDGGVELSKAELAAAVKFWSPEMRDAAIADNGDRIELINMALASKKVAALADSIAPDESSDAYWRYVFSVRQLQTQYVVKQHLDSLDVPDMSELAVERYATQKDKYALVPEERYSSHILLLCEPGKCDRDARRVEAEKILAELKAGADFRELAGKYSEDPGSKGKGGQFDSWIRMGQPRVEPYYVGAVFDIEKVGEISGIVDTRFGLHIVRLDDVRPAHYKSFEETRDLIVATLEAEYIQLAAKQFDAQFRLSDDAYIDGAAIDAILAPYAPEAATAE